MASYPCSDDPREVIDAIAGVGENAEKFDRFINGGSLDEVQLGEGQPTPTLRNLARLVKSAASTLDGSDVSGKFSDAANGGEELRMLADRFGDVFNVKDFGALGDCSSGWDDSVPIQAALDAAGEAGGVVFFPHGTYCCKDTVWIPSGVTLEGSGSTVKRMFNTGPSGHSVLAGFKPVGNEETIHDIAIRDVTFDGNGGEYGEVSFDIMAFCSVPGFNILIENCTFLDIVDYHAIDIMRTQYVTIRSCRFMGWDHRHSSDGWAANAREMIQLDGGDVADEIRTSHVLVEDCWFGESDIFGAPPTALGNHGWFDSSLCISDIVFRNNTCVGMTFAGVQALAWQNVLVDGNTFTNTGTYGVSICSRNNSTASVSAVAKDVKVVNNTFKNDSNHATGNGVCVWCSAGRDYDEEAVEGAVPNNIIIANNSIAGVATGVRIATGNGIFIQGNIFRDCAVANAIYVATNLLVDSNIYFDSGVIWLDSTLGTYTTTDDLNRNKQIRNNIFIRPLNRAIHIGNNSPNCLIENNYVEADSSDPGSSYEFIAVNSSSTPMVCRNNVIVAKTASRSNAITISSYETTIVFNNIYLVDGTFVWPYTYRKAAQIADSSLHITARKDSDNYNRAFFGVNEDGARCDMIGLVRGTASSNNRLLEIGAAVSASESYASIRMHLGNQSLQFSSDYFLPLTTNAVSLGGGSNEWSHVYAHTGTVETSDERLKQDIAPIPEAVLRAWGRVQFQQYRLRDSVEEKGENARIHTGMVAQRIKEAFEAEGLDPFRYGLLCYDEWEERPAETDGEGVVVVPAQAAGNKYALRYDECLSLECAYQRWKLQQIEARLAALEVQ